MYGIRITIRINASRGVQASGEDRWMERCTMSDDETRIRSNKGTRVSKCKTDHDMAYIRMRIAIKKVEVKVTLDAEQR